MKAEHVLNVHDEVGETPIWIAEEGALYWIDLEGKRIHRYVPADGDVITWHLDVPVTALARRSPQRWILATKEGLYFWDQNDNSTTFIVDPEAENPDVRFNDGAVDRQGRFLIGTLNQKDLEAPDGSLYRLDADTGIHRLDGGYATSNGIGLSPDGATLYVTDMFNNRIIAYDYDTAEGTVDKRRVFVDVPAETGLPDGLVVDAEGGVWSAHWGGSRVTRYTPEGRIRDEVMLPVSNVTCMGFGGSDLKDLYVTTAWFMLDEAERRAQPQAGDLFRIRTDVKGLPEPSFAG